MAGGPPVVPECGTGGTDGTGSGVRPETHDSGVPVPYPWGPCGSREQFHFRYRVLTGVPGSLAPLGSVGSWTETGFRGGVRGGREGGDLKPVGSYLCLGPVGVEGGGWGGVGPRVSSMDPCTVPVSSVLYFTPVVSVVTVDVT